MRTPLHVRRLLIAVVLGLSSSRTAAQEVVRQHLGANDPVSEGFRLYLGGGSTVGPVTNDLGRASWSLSSGGDPVNYFLALSPQEQASVAGQGLVYAATLRLVRGPNMLMVLYAGSEKFVLGFDRQSNGDPVVNAESAPSYSLDPVFVFEGGGGGYHTYEIAYSAETRQAVLSVDGVKRVNELPSISGIWGWGGYWGAVQGSISQANWSSVTFAIVPEPSCLALFGCCGLLLCARCLRAIAARQSSAACGRSGGLAFQPAQSGAEAPACRAVTGTVTELNALPDVDYPWGNNYPESTDECLKTAVEARQESLVSPQIGRASCRERV